MNKRSLSILADFTWREILSPYRNSWFGITWIVLNPLILVGIYTLVFSHFLGIRFAPNENNLDYSISLAARLSVFTFFSQALSATPDLISSAVHYVKKIVFPLPVIVLSHTLVDLIHLLIVLALTTAIHMIHGGIVPITCFLFVVAALLSTVFFCFGTALLISALGVYLPDLRQALPNLARILIFISPVFYPVTNIPEKIRPWAYLNPATWMIEMICETLTEGVSPELSVLFQFSGICILTFLVGWSCFHKLRPGFADVL